MFLVLLWSLNRARQAKRSIGGAEILADGETMSEGKVLARLLTQMYFVEVPLHIV